MTRREMAKAAYLQIVCHLVRTDPLHETDLTPATLEALKSLSILSYAAGLDPRDLGEACFMPEELLKTLPKQTRPEEG